MKKYVFGMGGKHEDIAHLWNLGLNVDDDNDSVEEIFLVTGELLLPKYNQ